MDLRQLESLLAVLEAPTMTRAAEGLHLSTAAVSIQLQSLASELGVELFVRSGRKLTPTPAALRLAETCKASHPAAQTDQGRVFQRRVF